MRSVIVRRVVDQDILPVDGLETHKQVKTQVQGERLVNSIQAPGRMTKRGHAHSAINDRVSGHYSILSGPVNDLADTVCSLSLPRKEKYHVSQTPRRSCLRGWRGYNGYTNLDTRHQPEVFRRRLTPHLASPLSAPCGGWRLGVRRCWR